MPGDSMRSRRPGRACHGGGCWGGLPRARSDPLLGLSGREASAQTCQRGSDCPTGQGCVHKTCVPKCGDPFSCRNPSGGERVRERLLLREETRRGRRLRAGYRHRLSHRPGLQETAQLPGWADLLRRLLRPGRAQVHLRAAMLRIAPALWYGWALSTRSRTQGAASASVEALGYGAPPTGRAVGGGSHYWWMGESDPQYFRRDRCH